MKHTDALVSGYLKRLENELSDLPRARRRELVEEISEHIDEARSGRELESEADLRNLLDRLGEPADIAAEARERLGVPPKKSGAGEVGALIMLSIGGVIVPILGWVVGVVLLWVSDVWSKREKLIGTLVVPGGLLLPIFAAQRALDAPEPAGDPSTLVSILEFIGVLALVVAQLVTIAYLARRMRERSGGVWVHLADHVRRGSRGGPALTPHLDRGHGRSVGGRVASPRFPVFSTLV